MIKGEDLFMNPEFMTPKQRQAILIWLGEHSQSETYSSILTKIVLSGGMEIEVDEQRLIAQEFMREFRPAIYEYRGGIGIRISNISSIIENEHGKLRDLLVENGEIDETVLFNEQGNRIGQEASEETILEPITVKLNDRSIGLDKAAASAVKMIIDEQIGSMYASLGQEITFPKTVRDLHTNEGRLVYLREIRQMNKCLAEEVAKQFIRNTAQQLGLIHGTGGHGGGCRLVSRIGIVRLDFQDAEENDYKCAFTLAKEGEERDFFHWFDKDPPEEGSKKLNLRKILFINRCGDFFDEMGTYGGITRGDNVATTGFRDFDTVRLYGKDRMIDQLIDKYHPKNLFKGWERSFLKYCYIHQKQEADLSLFLMAFHWRQLKYVPGTLMNFAALLGCDYDNYQALENLFLREYNDWRSKGLQKLAPEWFREIEERLNRGELEFEYEAKNEAHLENETQKRIVYNLVFNPASSLPRSL